MSAPLQIGLLVFPKVTQLDFTGPLAGVRRPARRENSPDLETHRAGAERLRCLMLTPTVKLACPQLDVICVPGGGSAPTT